MPFAAELLADHMLEAPLFLPAIKGWNRLEGRPRQDNFERALRAEVRDPLWFLARQWQFGELDGEDAGSPIDARLVADTRSLHAFRARGEPPIAHDPATPLEATVEAEQPPFDLVVHRQINQALARMVPAADAGAIKTALITAFPLTAAAVEGYGGDEATRRALLLAVRNLFSGSALLAAVAGTGFDAKVDTMILSGAAKGALKAAGAALDDWYRSLYGLDPSPAAGAWVPERLEYGFACSVAAPGQSETVLVADGYDGGELDWWSFDVGESAGLGLAGATPPAGKRETLSFLPAPVSFAGMPRPRFWEMEDGRTEFADVEASTTDIAKILLTEFALVYANDWCLVPLVVPVGSMTSIEGLLVTDTFGEKLLVRPAGRGRDEDWQQWRMFALDSRAAGDVVEPLLFVPPVTAKQMTGLTIEKVLFLRDEMANMAWAVEAIIPSALGNGVDGYAVAERTAPPPPTPPPLPEGVEVRYELGSDVPWNWRPFAPVRIEGSVRAVRLRRSRLPPPDRPIRGRILAVPSPYDLFEEEVPRSGKQVAMSFQRARWTGGAVHLWVGRRAVTGRGEGSSGLAFDQLREPGDERHIK